MRIDLINRLKGQGDFKKLANKHGIDYSLIKAALSKNYRKEIHEKFWWEGRKFAGEDGYKLTKDSPSLLFNEVLLDKIYDVEGFKPKENNVVIDIGAYYGDSAIWWAKEFKANVIAFEPLKEAYNELLENAKLNGVENRIKTYNIALGNGNEISGGKGNGTMFRIGLNEEKFSSKRLDDFSFDKIDIIKIDVEGFEVDVLEGAKKTITDFKPKIIIETHSKELRKRCDEILRKLGYTLKFEGRKVISRQKGFDEVVNLFYYLN